jgi:hypothetical protein
MATLTAALSERIPLKNGKTPTMSEVTITAMGTPSGSRLSAALWRWALGVGRGKRAELAGRVLLGVGGS